jgi:hypothetical protein
MADTITLEFTQDELEMLVDALEVDLEGYAEAAKEARMSNNREDIVTFSEAATRVQVLMDKLREHIEE